MKKIESAIFVLFFLVSNSIFLFAQKNECEISFNYSKEEYHRKAINDSTFIEIRRKLDKETKCDSLILVDTFQIQRKGKTWIHFYKGAKEILFDIDSFYSFINYVKFKRKPTTRDYYDPYKTSFSYHLDECLDGDYIWASPRDTFQYQGNLIYKFLTGSNYISDNEHELWFSDELGIIKEIYVFDGGMREYEISDYKLLSDAKCKKVKFLNFDSILSKQK